MTLPSPRRLLLSIVVAAATAFATLVAAGQYLSHPALHSLGPAPVDLHAQSFTVRLADGGPVAGWDAPGLPGAGAVLLLHGVRADRTEMAARAEFLHRLGYSVVLIDLPGHGESTAAHITFGHHESQGVSAALRYVQQRYPGERVGVVGVSLGAASFVLSRATPAPAAVVLESMFPTIDDAVRDRLQIYLGAPARTLAPLLLTQLPLQLSVSPQQLRPIDLLPTLNAPVLIAAGSEDRHTHLVETQRLYDAAARPKSLWIVPGAAHVDLHQFAPAEYERRIGAFLQRYLRT